MTGWRSLRRAVFVRDQGICQVCRLRVGKLWDAGHLVDRCVGGQDELDNLVLMCLHCNRTEKPIHRTLAEAREWLEQQHQPVPANWRDFCMRMYRAS